LSLSAGSVSNLGTGGNIVLQGGSSQWIGSNILLRPGAGDVADGVVKFEVTSTTPYAIFSDYDIELYIIDRCDITAGTFFVNAHHVLFRTSYGVNIGHVPMSGFSYRSGTLSASYTLRLDSQMGTFTVPVLDYYESSVTMTIYNRYVVNSSIAFFTVVSSSGTFCQPKVKRATCSFGQIVVELYDYFGSECTSDAVLGFFLLIP
jgi:hypothetical protein